MHQQNFQNILNEFKGRVLDQETLDAIQNRVEQETQKVFAEITWTEEDIAHARPNWSEEKISMVADSIGGELEEGSIEKGWAILDYLISEYDGDE